MRITRDLLLNIAKDTVKRQTFGGHDLVCVYLTGSLIYDQPLLGGITDIDLIYVHTGDIPCEREIVPITDEIHLDIAHYSQSLFALPRKLRSDAWIGSFLCHDPIVLFDTQHWFDYTQAGVSAQFFQPSNVMLRAKCFSERARSAWLAMRSSTTTPQPTTILDYLSIIKNCANAIACLTSVPLTDRRFLIDYTERAMSLQMPGLAGGLVDLLLPEDAIEPNWDTWLENWKNAYLQLLNKKDVPLGLSNGRLIYYEKAIMELQASRQEAALWILLWTWSRIAALLPERNSEINAYNNFCSALSLDQTQVGDHLTALDTYLDRVEEIIENWGYQNGV